MGRGRAWVKISRFNACSRNVNTTSFKIFPHLVEQTCLRENSISILERESPKEFIEIWKNISLRLILKGKSGIYTVYHFFDSNNLGVEIYPQKGGGRRKRVRLNRRLRHLCTLVLWFQGNIIQGQFVILLLFWW